jgi:hypothetical protein
MTCSLNCWTLVVVGVLVLLLVETALDVVAFNVKRWTLVVLGEPVWPLVLPLDFPVE